ncbi:hypothetical protein LTS15_006661 [Exophiala xenobiotica]|nr:hypothetical protein LTS15_006661 [Exophiala xenobiotica]
MQANHSSSSAGATRPTRSDEAVESPVGDYNRPILADNGRAATPQAAKTRSEERSSFDQETATISGKVSRASSKGGDGGNERASRTQAVDRWLREISVTHAGAEPKAPTTGWVHDDAAPTADPAASVKEGDFGSRESTSAMDVSFAGAWCTPIGREPMSASTSQKAGVAATSDTELDIAC